jgi:hypothetical protein
VWEPRNTPNTRKQGVWEPRNTPNTRKQEITDCGLFLGGESREIGTFRTLQKHRENTQKFGSCPLRSKTLVFPGFFAYWANCFGFPAYPCMSMPAGAAPGEIIVLCAALDPTNISVSRASESPESSHNPRFSRENMWFCSGGAGFELGKFES